MGIGLGMMLSVIKELCLSRGLRASRSSARVLNVMVGLSKYVFISVKRFSVLHSVSPGGATFQPIMTLTRHGVVVCNLENRTTVELTDCAENRTDIDLSADALSIPWAGSPAGAGLGR